MALSTEETKKRLQRLSNLEHLHAQQGTQLTKQREQNTELKAEITRLKRLVAEQSTTIETLHFSLQQILISRLCSKVFSVV
jgi:cell division protein FtsB